jgi:hypothetical protein
LNSLWCHSESCRRGSRGRSLLQFDNNVRSAPCVVNCIGQFVTDGSEEWEALDNADTLLRFGTGETLLKAKTMIVRLA